MFFQIFVLLDIIVQLSSCEESKMIGGELVDKAELPFMVSVQRASRDEGESFFHICGGSIIRPVVVLTAAHCVSNPLNNTPDLKFEPLEPSEIVVLAGTAALTDNCEFARVGKSQKRKVSEIIVHALYDPTLVIFDVAILKLHFHFILNNAIKLVPLVSRSTLQGKKPWEFFRGNCITAGWGRTSPLSSQYTLCLRQINISLVTNEMCNELLHGGRVMLNNELCTFSRSRYFCHADTGGPLVCQNFQVGLAVVGPLCSDFDMAPGVWARMDTYEEWIMAKLHDKLGKNAEQDAAAAKISFYLLYLQMIYFVSKLLLIAS